MEEYLRTLDSSNTANSIEWVEAGMTQDFPPNGGLCIKVGQTQIAVYRFDRVDNWYATQNLCPHKLEMVLSRGMLGDEGGIPKLACPMHKKTFSLETGENLNGDLPNLKTYPVKVEQDIVYVGFSE